MADSTTASSATSSGRTSPISSLVVRKPTASVVSQATEVENVSTAIDAPQSAQQTKTSYRASVFRVWWLEIGSCLVAVGMLMAVIFTLLPYQDKTLPKLPYRVSVNTILSIFATIVKTACLLLLAQGLGQLKWEYYKQRRPLSHFTIFDAASRGPWGCVVLIFELRCRRLLPMLGALVSILVLVLEPFIQSPVSYYPCSGPVRNGSVAYIPRANNFTELGDSGFGLGITYQLSVAQMGTVVSGFYQPGLARIEPDCPTGNCTFPGTYASFGYCSQCIDVTDEVSYRTVNGTGVTYLPSGANATDGIDSSSRLFSVTPANMSSNLGIIVEMVMLEGSDANGISLANAFSNDRGRDLCLEPAFKEAWGCKNQSAARCSIYPCVKTYKASVNNGVLNETVIDTFADWHLGSNNSGSTAYNSCLAMADLDCVSSDTRNALRDLGYNTTGRFMPWNCLGDGGALQPDYDTEISSLLNISLVPEQQSLIPKACIYQGLTYAVASYSKFLYQFLNGHISVFESDLVLRGSTELLTIFNNSLVTLESIDTTLNGIADSITKRIRSVSASNNGWNLPATGVVNSTETCLRLHWLWLIYPASVILLTILFLLLMLVQTERTENADGLARGWKTSPLPLIYHPINVLSNHNSGNDEDDEFMHPPARYSDVGTMEEAVKKDLGYITNDVDGLLSHKPV